MTYHIIICTGRPASGKTTLLKELAMTGERSRNWYSYCDIDRYNQSMIFNLSDYHSKTQLLDGLFMETNKVFLLLEAMRTKYKSGGNKGDSKLTIYRFEDNKEQCLENDKLRPIERRARATIGKPYYIDFDLLIKEYPDIKIEIIDTPVYRPTEWEVFFTRTGVTLDYKVIADDHHKTYEVVEDRVNKRYITSDYWDTNCRSKTYNRDWVESWISDDDSEPVKFVELENFLLTIPALTYKQGLEISELVKVVSYSINDYYSKAERHYHCIDAELLYNYLMSARLLND